MIITIGTDIFDSEGNKYSLIEEINKGGFAKVFKAQINDSDDYYAVKILDSSFGTPEQYQSFKNEIEMAKKINDEHVVKYFYTHDGEDNPNLPPFIVMEYSEDGDLCNTLQSIDHNDVPKIVDICTQLAYGMKAINEHIVHRDIKPQNVLVFQDVYKISDFGISKTVDEKTRTLTFKGFGTSMYYPPEAWEKAVFTMQGDMYSMGIVFYQLITGEYPYENITDENAYMDAHMYQTPTAIKTYNPHVSPRIVSMINKMLEKSPARRFDSWDEIIDCLEEETQNVEITPAVKNAVEKKILADNKRETYLNRKKQLEDSIRDMNKKAWSQFNTQIKTPLIELIEEFNNQYAGEDKITYTLHGYSLEKDSNEMTVYLGKLWVMRISVETVPYGSIDPRSGMLMRDSDWLLSQKGDSPKYKGKNIIAWGTLNYNDGRGHNLLLVEEDESGYGTWYLMRNTDMGFGRSQHGPGPFAFRFEELYREIGYLNALHIYKSEVMEFDAQICIEELPF